MHLPMDNNDEEKALVADDSVSEQIAAGDHAIETQPECHASSSSGVADGESELTMRPWLKPGAWGKKNVGALEPVWMVVGLQASGSEKHTKDAKGKQKAKKKNKQGYSDVAPDAKVEDLAEDTKVLCTTVEPARASGMHVLPSIDKILRAAANQAGLLKKRDISTARIFIAFNSDGELMEDPTELISDSEAQALLAQDGCGVIIVPDGKSLERPSDELVELMQSLQLEISRKSADLESSRVARQQAREAEGAPLGNGGDMAPVLFWKDTDKNGYLSNWARSPFRVDGQQFNCAEQYIMWSKAVTMGDDATRQQIMATLDPQKQKALGKQVHPWKDALWKRRREPVMVAAARAKFTQDPVLSERLLKTYPRRLAEASPSDLIYGIGLAPNDERAQDPKNWKGENMLGRVLEQIRQELLDSEATQRRVTVPTIPTQAVPTTEET